MVDKLFYCSTFVCPTEIVAFSDRAEDFRKIDCEVLAASCDSQYSHLAWINTPRNQGGLGKMDIPILADKSGKIAKEYGRIIIIISLYIYYYYLFIFRCWVLRDMASLMESAKIRMAFNLRSLDERCCKNKKQRF